ncbi:hypothetical protein [Mycolicibacterium vulneris]|nr:hypothetical protein [Mycolicibacterium vulneris]
MHFTGRMIPLNFYVPTAVTRETNCLLQAIDQQRYREAPYWVLRARQCAAGCDDQTLPMDARLSLREELNRIMSERLNTRHHEPESPQSLEDDVRFWTEKWESIKQESPNNTLFQAVRSMTLLARLWVTTNQTTNIS